MPRLGIVADDLTGATTVGALLARSGINNVVFFDREHINVEGLSQEAVVVTSDSRPLAASVAHERVYQATRNLKAQDIQFFSKRIDTTCRGGIGAEVEGMLDALKDSGDERIAIVVPAMPQSRRIVIGGYSLIDSVLLAKTGVAEDVRTPVTESYLPKLIGDQIDGKLAHIGIDAVTSGHDDLTAELISARQAGPKAILIDAVSIEDVALIAECVKDLEWDIVSVDPGPFTQQYMIAQGLGIADDTQPVVDCSLDAESDGVVLVVAGSATEVTHRQMANLLERPQSSPLRVSIPSLVQDGDALLEEAAKHRKELGELLSKPGYPKVIVLGLESTLSGNRLDIEALEKDAGLAPGDGAVLISQRFGELANRIACDIGPRLSGIYLTGGDVMVATCSALGASGLDMVDYVIPQADQARLVGGGFDGLPVVCKGGLTGNPDTAIQCVERILRENRKQ